MSKVCLSALLYSTETIQECFSVSTAVHCMKAAFDGLPDLIMGPLSRQIHPRVIDSLQVKPIDNAVVCIDRAVIYNQCTCSLTLSN